jgi:NADPH:quinone reductase-like Zn-dependent oxidoreductase
MITQVQVRRSAFAETQVVSVDRPELADGEILVAIDRFAMTANNVSYALSGDMIGYWKFFPVAEPWGIVPVWGFADVIESRTPDVAVGERIWGFLPMASHLVMHPAAVTGRAFNDGAAHRADLPGIYNNYQRTSGDPAALTAMEDARCLLFPLFSTSYVLYDYLVDNDFFGARQVLVGSASSKTGLGLTNLLSRHGDGRPRVVGLTSPRNAGFVTGLGTCDEVITYDAISGLDPSLPTAFVDMSGDGDVVTAVHARFGANLKLSCAVGATHWGAGRYRPEQAATPHTFFFAPAQFAKRDVDWGPGEIMRRAQAEATRMSAELKGTLEVQHERGSDAVIAAWRGLVGNTIAPNVALMASLT